MATRGDNVPTVSHVEWSEPEPAPQPAPQPVVPDRGPFWRDNTLWFGVHGVVPRALRTFGQTAAAVIGVDTFSGWSLQWHEVAITAAVAAVLSLLMSLDGTTHPKGDSDVPLPHPLHPVEHAPIPEQYTAVPLMDRGCGHDLRG